MQKISNIQNTITKAFAPICFILTNCTCDVLLNTEGQKPENEDNSEKQQP